MTTQNQLPETSTEVVQEFSAPIADVYKALTDAKTMVQWMGPGEISCKKVKINFKVGGSYSIHMHGCDDKEETTDHVAIGKYQEIVPNQKLKFSWTWEDGRMPDTNVTITFEEVGASTRLTLLHEDFPEREVAERHNQGWKGCFVKLEKLLASKV